MDRQFDVDVPRVVFFIDDEYVPTKCPRLVFDRLVREFGGDERVACNVSNCFKQQFLSDHYIRETIGFCADENLLSHGTYSITLDKKTKTIRVDKDFIHSLIVDGDLFNLDYCVLRITFDPFKNVELGVEWDYTIKSSPLKRQPLTE